MSPIKSRKHALPRSPLAATLATGLALGASLSAHAQSVGGPSAEEGEQQKKTTTLDKVEVQGERVVKIASPKFTQSLQDTPQTIQVISSDLFNEQGATTLSEALRNSAGVGTFFAGENGNTNTGDAIYMRGFDTSSSLFVDGVRDLGSISRDTFNIEQIEVVKGPAGSDNGRSAPTGAINLVSKQAQLRDGISGTVMAGVDGQKRTTADWSQQLGETSALRINAMWQDSDVPGRDHVNNSRWGLAPSLGFGLGTPTRLFLNLLYVKQDNVPDGFVPTIGLPGWEPQAGQSQLVGHPVDPENFYGTKHDHDDVTAQMATLRFEHDFSDAVTLTNTTRWGKTEQDYMLTAFMHTGANVVSTNPADLSTYTMRRSNPTFKDVRNEIVTNQTNLRADFATGAVEHNLSAGVEFIREEQDNWTIAVTNATAWPYANLYNPNWDVDGLTWAHNGASTHGKTTTSSAYVFDTLKFGPSFMLTAGLRFDHYKTEYTSIATTGVATPLEDSDTLLNWKLGAVYKVGDTLSLYANYALSQQPPGGANFQLSAAVNNANNPNMDPQKAKTFEVGAKWNLLDERLAVNAALFRTDVTNEIDTSQTPPTQDGEKRVKGIELSAVGNLTAAWSISAGYSHLDTEVIAGPLITSDGTPNLTYTPGDSFTAWTSYRLPFGLTIGGGARHMGGLHRGTDGAVGTPKYTESYTVFDAVVSYALGDNATLRLNAYNLTDKHYVAAINKSGYRYLPGTPRTFTLSVDYRF